MPVQKKTKIFCTMGPACWDVPTLLTLIDAGMNTARLNFSHGDHEAHGATLKRVREANAQRPDKHIAILLDTKGPEIRTGFFQEKCGGKIHLKAGQALEITTDYSYKGDESKIACTYEKLPTSVKPGSTILIADGSLVLTVTECLASSVKCKVENDQSIGERKNMNLPNVKVDLPVLQEKDINDLQKFGVPNQVDFVAASFVQSAADVLYIRSILDADPRGKDIKIISKIENQEVTGASHHLNHHHHHYLLLHPPPPPPTNSAPLPSTTGPRQVRRDPQGDRRRDGGARRPGDGDPA